MGISQLSFTAGEVTKRLGGRVDLAKYASALETCLNALPQPHGGITRRPGTQYIATCNEVTTAARLFPFEYSTEQAYIIEAQRNRFQFYMDGAQIQAGSVPYHVDTNYTSAQLPAIKFTQSADVLYLVHLRHPPAKLSRTTHAGWTLADIDFDWPAFGNANTTAITLAPAQIGVATTTVGASAALFKDDWVGDSIKFNIGYVNITSVPSSTQALVNVASTLATTVATTEWTRSAWNENDKYPMSVMFFEERLGFAATLAQPQTVWLSVSGDYENFCPKAGATIVDTDAVTFTISSDQVNEIRWMAPTKKLVLGTTGGEWLMYGGNDEGISPSNIKCDLGAPYGVATVMPVNIGSEIVFVQKAGVTYGKKVRGFAYDFTSDSFKAAELNILAEHLTRNNNIVDMDFQAIPNQVLWCVRDDGDEIALTYLKEHEVVGWSHHTFTGDSESVACIPGTDEDEVWRIVERTINGSVTRYVECAKPYWSGEDVKDSFFVDSGLTYSGTAATTISGLSHLEGQFVTILADGVHVNSATVSGGAITLATAASKVHVGLPITTDIKTLRAGPVEVQGKIKRISAVVIRFFETAGVVYIGSSESDIATTNLGSTPVTKDIAFTMPTGYDTDGQVFIRKTDPYPMTILAIIPITEDYNEIDRIST